jgi:broad specificity phosphatase PhoE
VERFRGRIDIKLDELGLQQAEAAGERIAADWPVTAIYSSPLSRSMTTAERAAKRLNLEVIPLDGIIDMDFGEWEGLSPKEAQERDSALFHLWQTSPHLVKFPKGESLPGIAERLATTVDDLVIKHPDETIVLASHRVICIMLVLNALGLDASHFWQIGQEVCAIHVIQINNNVPSVLLLNDTCHLEKLKNKSTD